MQQLIESMKKLNRSCKGMPRKAGLLLAVFIFAFLLVKVLPFLWPFVLGLLLAGLLNKVVFFLTERFQKLRMGRTPATILAMVLIYGSIGVAFFFLSRQLFIEGKKLYANLPGILRWVETTMTSWVERFTPSGAEGAERQAMIAKTLESVSRTVMTGAKNLVSKFTPAIASGAWHTVTGLPHFILFVVMTIMSSFYFSRDKERIYAYFVARLPESTVRRIEKLKHSMAVAVVQQIKAQVTISFAIMIALIIGFYIIGIDYALLLGFIIGFLDVLPIIGAGTFLIPWALFNLFAGKLALGFSLALMYVVVVAIRQIIEPRIVSHRLGLYPLASMLSMYVGLKLMGFIGLIVGPLVANIAKAVVEMDNEGAEVPALPEPKKQQV